MNSETEKTEIKNNKNNKEKSNKSALGWFVTVFVITFVLSIIFSFVSTNAMGHLDILPAVIILFAVILVGILFDLIGIAVTVADEDEFHAKASKKVRGAKTSVKLIRNSSKVANFCADIIGDICGVLSGAISALIAIKITDAYGLQFNVQFLVSALVAAITVSGKAIGKDIAKANSTSIVHTVAKVLNTLHLNRK